MLGQIFLSRYQVEEALHETALYSAWRVNDILSERDCLLYLYPAGDRVPLDPKSFRYRQSRFRRALPDSLPDCQIGQDGDTLYILCEKPDGCRPLRLPLGERETNELLAGVLLGLARSRAEGLRICDLVPESVWLREDGGPFFLPPSYLHFPGLLDGAPDAEASAPELRWGSGRLRTADVYSYGRFLERVSTGQPAWDAFRAEQLPGLLNRDPARRPTLEQIVATSPLAEHPLLLDLPDSGRGGWMPGSSMALSAPDVEAGLQAAVDAWRRGRSVLLGLRAESGLLGPHHDFLEDWFGLNADQAFDGTASSWLGRREQDKRGQSFFQLCDFDSPELLFNPLWRRLAGREPKERFFVVYDAGGLAESPDFERRVLGLLRELPFLHEDMFELPGQEGMAEGDIAELDPAERPLLEILSLQEEPVTLGFLAKLFPVHEDAFFDLIEGLERKQGLDWRSGIDQIGEIWGLRGLLTDARRRRQLRDALPAARRRDLHRLCLSLIDSVAPSTRNPLRSLLRFRHLVGSETWSQAAREGLELFRWAVKQEQELLVEDLARSLVLQPVEGDLNPVGKREVYLHLGRQLLRQGRPEEAQEILRRGLRSLTGNHQFVEELLAQPAKRPEMPLKTETGTLRAVSALIRCLGEICETRGEFALGVTHLSRLLDAYSEDFSARERGILYNDLAWLHYRLGQHDSAVERCEAALRLFDPQKELLELGQTYNTLGVSQWALDNWAEAETYYKRALALRQRAGDESSIAASLNNLGNLYRVTERLSLAIDYFKQSMAIKKRLKNYPGYLVSLYNVALISFEMMNDLDAARAQCLECLDLNRTVGNVQIGAEVKGLLGEIALFKGDYAEARRYIDEAIQTCREIGGHTELGTMLRRLVGVLLGKNELDAAREAIDEGLEVNWRVGSRYEEALIRVYEGEYFLARNDPDAAAEAFGKAADVFSLLDKFEWLARVYCRIGLVQLDRAREQEARECLRQATEIIERRKVTAIISEWDTLQARLQQYLGHFTDRIKGEGKEHLASLYQILNLMGDHEDPTELLGKILVLLQSYFNYHRIGLCLLDAPPQFGEHGAILFSPEAYEDQDQWLERAGEIRQQTGLDVQAVELEGRPLQRLFVPLRTYGTNVGFLAVERDPGDCESDEVDFLFSIGRILALRLALSESGIRGSMESGQESAAPGAGSAEFQLIGQGRDMQRLRQLIAQVRNVDATVLITGESGTGKEEVARCIHYSGIRADRPFLPVNCASIPETLLESILFGHERGAFTGATHRHIGVFEEAGAGTVFLDEIGEMGSEMQSKLLRILQNKQFTRVGGTRSIASEARVLTATNQDLATEVRSRRFREDLFYRINVLRIHTAAIREKREDIPLLIDHFMQSACEDQGIALKRLAPEVMELFLKHSWPGNVRQMKNVISSCVILSRGLIIQKEDLPEDFLSDEREALLGRSLDEVADMVIGQSSFSEDRPLEESLLAYLAKRLVAHVGSKARAARLLGISKPTLYRRLKHYDILKGRGER